MIDLEEEEERKERRGIRPALRFPGSKRLDELEAVLRDLAAAHEELRLHVERIRERLAQDTVGGESLE